MKLNNKTIRNYLFYSSIIFLLTIPVFYLVMRSVLLHSVDSSLRSQLREIRSNLNEIRSREDVAMWSRLDKDISLSPAGGEQKDSIYTINRYNSRHSEWQPFREIAGMINIKGESYQLIIRSSLVENDDLLGSILIVQIGVLIILIAGLLWINQRISQKLWRPFYVALKNMQAFEPNKQSDLEFIDSTTDEFNELNKAVRHFFIRSTESYQQQKEFTENASHEMQTPLAIFQSKVELLMQTAPLSEEQAMLIGALDETNRRLIKLNKSLLLLTKIENNQYHATEAVSLAPLCERLIQQFHPYAEEKRLFIQARFDANTSVFVNPTLIEILIANLLSNAIRYNRQDGEIMLTIDKNSLTIENTGIFQSLNAEKIFDRFHKQTGPAGTEDSTGLGLAIARNICALYNFRIDYSFDNSWHQFRVGFDTEIRQNRNIS